MAATAPWPVPNLACTTVHARLLSAHDASHESVAARKLLADMSVSYCVFWVRSITMKAS
jgi:hypothetical protein